MNARSRFLAAALAVTVAASGWLAMVPEAEPVVVQPRQQPLARPAPPEAVAHAPVSAARGSWPQLRAGVERAWGAPQAPAVAPATAAAPPAATAPAFPYRWIGRLEDGNVLQALLSGPQRSMAARAGDLLDGQWQVDRIDAARMELTWLPTGESVAVDFIR